MALKNNRTISIPNELASTTFKELQDKMGPFGIPDYRNPSLPKIPPGTVRNGNLPEGNSITYKKGDLKAVIKLTKHSNPLYSFYYIHMYEGAKTVAIQRYRLSEKGLSMAKTCARDFVHSKDEKNPHVSNRRLVG